jgi:hypothetical protein
LHAGLVYTDCHSTTINNTTRVNSRIRNTSLSQQMAMTVSGLCLLVSLALVTLGTISSRHMQMELQKEYGATLAHLIARRIGTSMETGDLLSVSASLRYFVEISPAQEASITDVEGKTLGQAGKAMGLKLYRYSAPVLVESNIAGEVVISISADSAHAALFRYVVSLLGLAILLSLAVYIVTRHLGQQLGDRLASLARSIRLEEEDTPATPVNEITMLTRQIEALPMDLLRTRSDPGPQDENYQTTAVLYLNLSSLMNYVDTLDEQSLQRYTDRLHQVVFAAAGFYAGELQVARQFGLAVYFTGHNSAGSAAFRASSCAWLVRSVSTALEQQVSLSMTMAMAISQSELGVADGTDIYPGLYMQHTLDELQGVCTTNPPGTMLSPAACEDVDVSSRMQYRATDDRGYAVLEEFAGPYQDLLERQLRLILKRLTDPGRR